jgi:RNA polymerase sigma-70 factor (ECF subfamily)
MRQKRIGLQTDKDNLRRADKNIQKQSNMRGSQEIAFIRGSGRRGNVGISGASRRGGVGASLRKCDSGKVISIFRHAGRRPLLIGGTNNASSGNMKQLSAACTLHDRKNEIFSQLMAKHYRFIYCLALKSVHEHYFAEEIAQESFFRAYKAFQSLNDMNKFFHWLVVIARNTTKAKMKKQRAESRERPFPADADFEALHIASSRETLPEYGDPAVAFEYRALRESLLGYVECLSDVEKQIFFWRYESRESYENISKRLNISNSTLRSKAHRLKNKLRAHILGV